MPRHCLPLQRDLLLVGCKTLEAEAQSESDMYTQSTTKSSFHQSIVYTLKRFPFLFLLPWKCISTPIRVHHSGCTLVACGLRGALTFLPFYVLLETSVCT